MTTWANGRRSYGPHCEGTMSQSGPDWYYSVQFSQWQAALNTTIELLSGGSGNNRPSAQAACDAQVAAWQEQFPMLEILAGQAQAGGQE